MHAVRGYLFVVTLSNYDNALQRDTAVAPTALPSITVISAMCGYQKRSMAPDLQRKRQPFHNMLRRQVMKQGDSMLVES